jgi:hypothetical protein
LHHVLILKKKKARASHTPAPGTPVTAAPFRA